MPQGLGARTGAHLHPYPPSQRTPAQAGSRGGLRSPRALGPRWFLVPRSLQLPRDCVCQHFSRFLIYVAPVRIRSVKMDESVTAGHATFSRLGRTVQEPFFNGTDLKCSLEGVLGCGWTILSSTMAKAVLGSWLLPAPTTRAHLKGSFPFLPISF